MSNYYQNFQINKDEELKMAHKMVEALTENSSVAFVVCSIFFEVIHLNLRFEQIFGWNKSDIIGKKLPILPDGLVDFEQHLKRHNYELNSYETTRKRKDGSLFVASEAVTPLQNEEGRIMAFAIINKDITDRKQAERRLMESEQRFKSLFDYNPSSVFSLDFDGTLKSVNPATKETTGYSSDELINKNIHTLVVSESQEKLLRMLESARKGSPKQLEIQMTHKNGSLLYLKVITVPMFIGKDVVGVYAIAENITEKKQNEQMINFMAYHDPLTEIPNRRLFQERANELIRKVKDQHMIGFLIIDLDKFKVINDTMGHSAGDEVLKVVAKRIQHSVRKEDTVARMGGDEFNIIIPGITLIEDIVQLASRVLQAFQEPLYIQNQSLVITPSIGISVYPNDGLDIDTLLNHADYAMYQVKQNGKNSYSFYSDTRKDG